MRATLIIAAFISFCSASPHLEPSRSNDSGSPLKVRAACAAQPSASNKYNIDLSSATNFRKDASAASLASSAPVPSGYFKTYTGLNGAANGLNYIGYSTIDSYDPATCAQKCAKLSGCIGFNIFFERDPVLAPDSALCPLPDPTVFIKCSYWGSSVDASVATNTGQKRAQFVIAIAGSNGYMAIPAIESVGASFCTSYITYVPSTQTTTVATTTASAETRTSTALVTTTVKGTSTIITTIQTTVSAVFNPIPKRAVALATPSLMSAWGSSLVSAACSVIATGKVTTSVTKTTSLSPVLRTQTATVIASSMTDVYSTIVETVTVTESSTSM